MDDSVKHFFSKNAEDGYAVQYDKDHGPRLDALIAKWDLINQCAGKKVLDVGGGLGFLGKRLGPKTDYWVVDGAEVPSASRVCNGTWYEADLDYHTFGSDDGDNGLDRRGPWDTAFCLETLEHLTNPYNCLAEIKKLVKKNGDIYISIPHSIVTHNYIYPALMVSLGNFSQFLGQMALPVTEYWLWNKGWPAHHFKCRNADWEEAVMLYPKDEPKFIGKTPVEYVNL